MGCDVHLFKINEILHERPKDRINSYVAFFDLKKAYDSINHRILIQKLECLFGNESEAMILIKHILSSVQVKIKEEDIRIFINSGVP